ncbi:DNA topoisomerase IB [Ensifer adhaerens]|uniref:DNA topoisomerase IB n=1 Tax=Ensifer canadensis TaxID=555315 RepID=UPI00149050E3|nr:DNA topoisomerase IB [Ensifer canadensis]NOV17704.1 DNA topoisomerase IB [Ensifer canadensis]
MEPDLIYVTDADPGIRRYRKGKRFSYRLPDGSTLKDPDTRARIAALGLPPAYERVWICSKQNGHLQATGFDARGRKQYRYHDAWQEMRNHAKFDQLIDFATALAKIRRTLRRHMDGPLDDARTVLAAISTLLDQASLRVGNATYVEENGTYGATTLLKRHLKLRDEGIELRFMGKGGKRVVRRLRSPRLQRLLEDIADLPGRQLFVSRDANGDLHPIDSGRLNRYLADISGAPISAKTFRTWAGSVAAFAEARLALAEGRRPSVKRMCEAAADVLHNTPAVCRKSYVHPDIIALADSESKINLRRLEALPRQSSMLRAEEDRLLRFLQYAVRAKRPAT